MCMYGLLSSNNIIQSASVASQAELEDQVWISTSFEDLCDQNVIVYLLRVKAKEYMPQVGIVTLCTPPRGDAGSILMYVKIVKPSKGTIPRSPHSMPRRPCWKTADTA